MHVSAVKIKVWILLAGLLSSAVSYGQEACGADIKNYLKGFSSKHDTGNISRPDIVRQIIMHSAPNSMDERWVPFDDIQILDLDADGDIEIIGRYDDPKWHSYRNRLAILNSMPQTELDKIIDSGDVWPSRFFSTEKFKDTIYIYSEQNVSEIMPYHELAKVLKGYKFDYKEIFLLNGKAHLLVSVVGDTETTRKYFVFKLKGTGYSEYCKYKV